MTDRQSPTVQAVDAMTQSTSSSTLESQPTLSSTNPPTTTVATRGLHRSSCSILYRKRMIAFRKAKANSAVTKPKVSSPSKDRVSPTSILGFPQVDSLSTTDCGDEAGGGRFNAHCQSSSSTSFEPLNLVEPLSLLSSQSAVEVHRLSSNNCLDQSTESSSTSASTSSCVEGENDELEDEIVYSKPFEPFACLPIHPPHRHHAHKAQRKPTLAAAASGSTSTATATTMPSLSSSREHQIAALMIRRNLDIATSTLKQQQQRHRSCIRRTKSNDEMTTKNATTTNDGIKGTASSNSIDRHVVFNETMDVRYFTRSMEEIAIMKQCAADRRQQHKARRLRRRRQLERAMMENNLHDRMMDEDDDDDDAENDDAGHTTDMDVVTDQVAAVVYRCGLPFQEPDEDGDDEDEPASPLFNRSTSSFTRAFSTHKNAQHHHRTMSLPELGGGGGSAGGMTTETPALPSPHRLGASSMLHDMMKEITGMISDAMVSVKTQTPREETSVAKTTTTTTTDQQPNSSNETQDPIATPTTTPMSPESASSLPQKSAKESESTTQNGPVSCGSTERVLDDDEGPWLLSVLHCGGGRRLSL